MGDLGIGEAALLFGGLGILGTWAATRPAANSIPHPDTPQTPAETPQTPAAQSQSAQQGAATDLSKGQAGTGCPGCPPPPDDPNKKKYSKREQKVIDQAKAIKNSPDFQQLVAANQNGEAADITVNGMRVSYEPDMPSSYSGMTDFEGNGFHLGPNAFSSESELDQTLLQETYRLEFSQAAGGVSGELAAGETDAASSFAKAAQGELR